MRLLAVHNILWSHYKARIFKGLQERSVQNNFDFYVIQLAYTEQSRAALGTDLSIHQYPYEVLFPHHALEEIPVVEKATKLLNKARHFKPTVLYLNGYYDPAYWLLMLYSQANNIKIVLDFESTEISRKRIWWKERLKRYFLRNCAGIVCLGTQAGIYAQTLGVPPHKILSTKNVGVDNEGLYELFKQSYPTRQAQKQQHQLPLYNFIYAGRFVKRKNLQRLMEAFDQAQRQASNGEVWGLILSGSGEEESSLKQLAQQCDSQHIRFFAPCEWYEVPARYVLGDVAVLPSTFEPFGFVTNEAMVYGMPVLVSERCGSAADLVVNGRNGYTFDPTNTEDLRQKLVELMQRTADFEQMGKEGQKIIAEWGPEVIVAELLNAFNKVSDT
jgi:glycosyltransferase involved in cell wall biosynthesis